MRMPFRLVLMLLITTLFSVSVINDASASGYVPGYSSFYTGLRRPILKSIQDRFEQKVMSRPSLKQAFGNQTLPFAQNLTNMIGPVKSFFNISKMLNQVNMGNLKGIMGMLPGMSGGFGSLMGGVTGLFSDNTQMYVPGMASVGEQNMCPIAAQQRLMASPIMYASPIAGSNKPLLRRVDTEYSPQDQQSPDQKNKDYDEPQSMEDFITK